MFHWNRLCCNPSNSMKIRIQTLVWAASALLAGLARAQAPAPQSSSPLVTLDEAIARARQYGGQVQGANLALLQAREDTRQVRANRLPSLNAFNQFIYTEGNGTPSGVFVANDGVHVYN